LAVQPVYNTVANNTAVFYLDVGIPHFSGSTRICATAAAAAAAAREPQMPVFSYPGCASCGRQ